MCYKDSVASTRYDQTTVEHESCNYCVFVFASPETIWKLIDCLAVMKVLHQPSFKFSLIVDSTVTHAMPGPHANMNA